MAIEMTSAMSGAVRTWPPPQDAFEPAGVLISWREDLFTRICLIVPVYHRLPATLGEQGLGHFPLQRHILASSSRQHFLGLPLISEYFLLESREKRAYRGRNCFIKVLWSWAGRYDGPAPRVCLTIPWHQRQPCLTEDRGYCPEIYEPILSMDRYSLSLCMNLHREESTMTLMKAKAIYM